MLICSHKEFSVNDSPVLTPWVVSDGVVGGGSGWHGPRISVKEGGGVQILKSGPVGTSPKFSLLYTAPTFLLKLCRVAKCVQFICLPSLFKN